MGLLQMKSLLHKKILLYKLALPIAIALGALTISSAGCLEHKAAAEKSAKEYAEEIIPNAVAYSCMNVDTDSDGYVGCSVRTKDDTLISLECVGAQFAWVFPKNSGCKLSKFKPVVTE